MKKPVFLTKSLFKTGFECPVKLRYAKDPAYGNNQEDNEFLLALAEGGVQVDELAKLMFPGGKEIREMELVKALAQTKALLTQSSATLFEAALSHSSYFVRVDVLCRHGNTVDIIEVKSKSYEPGPDGSFNEAFFKSKSGFVSKTKPYLLDAAFQTLVARLALPEITVRSFLLLHNKAKSATVDGLNQMFLIEKVDPKKRRVTCNPLPGLTAEDVGDPLLELLDVTELVKDILQAVHEIPA